MEENKKSKTQSVEDGAKAKGPTESAKQSDLDKGPKNKAAEAELIELKAQYEKKAIENDELANEINKQSEEIKLLLDKIQKLEKDPEPKKEIKETVPEFGKTPSFGQKMVGINFNPSGLNEVDFSKNIFANAIDQIHNIRKVGTSPTQNGLCEQAIQASLVAQMLCVKAITWQD